jgi:hypothetical protein
VTEGGHLSPCLRASVRKKQVLSRSHRDTEIQENEIGAVSAVCFLVFEGFVLTAQASDDETRDEVRRRWSSYFERSGYSESPQASE